jgi:hypothetical protein
MLAVGGPLLRCLLDGVFACGDRASGADRGGGDGELQLPFELFGDPV